jgi:hypothetical protein
MDTANALWSCMSALFAILHVLEAALKTHKDTDNFLVTGMNQVNT